MRKLATISLMGTLLIGCGGGDEVKDETVKETKVEEKKEFNAVQALKDGFKAFSDGDQDATMALYSDDAVWEGVDSPQPAAEGKEAIKQVLFGVFKTIYPDGKAGISKIYNGGDVLVVEGVFTGTNTGNFPDGKTATNKKAGNHYAHIWWAKDGMFTKVVAFSNEMTAPLQLGLMPPMEGMSTPAMAVQPSGDPEVVEAAANETNFKALQNAGNLMVAQKWDKLKMVCTDDVKFVDHGNHHVSAGVDKLGEFQTALAKPFSDHKLTFGDHWEFGDTVVARWTWSAKHTGDMGPMKATNKDVALNGLSVAHFKEGKIAHVTQYTNPMAMMMTLMPPKPVAAK